MSSVYLLRHGKYLNPRNIAPFRLPGVRLSLEGKKQALKNANFLKGKLIFLKTQSISIVVEKVLSKYSIE